MEDINYERLAFYCNACGETFNPNKRAIVSGIEMADGISPNDLPDALRKVYYQRWTDSLSCLCYLVTLDDLPGLLLISEYSAYDDEGNELSPTRYLDLMRCAANMDTLFNAISPNIRVLVGKNTGFCECDELATFLPATLTEYEKIRALYICDKAAFNEQFVPDYLNPEFIKFAELNRDSHCSVVAVDVPGIGTVVARDAMNPEHPGIVIDLNLNDHTSVGLANIQLGDAGRLQATVFAELGKDDYTHCVDFIKPGEEPVEHIDMNWITKRSRAAMACVADSYVRLLYEELIIDGLRERGYELTPLSSHQALVDSISDVLQEKLDAGCEESQALEEAIKEMLDKANA